MIADFLAKMRTNRFDPEYLPSFESKLFFEGERNLPQKQGNLPFFLTTVWKVSVILAFYRFNYLFYRAITTSGEYPAFF